MYRTYVIAGWAKSGRPISGIDERIGISVAPIVGVLSAAPVAPYSCRYSVAVAPRPRRLIAVPVIIWSARMWIENSANTAATIIPAIIAPANPAHVLPYPAATNP